MAQTDTVIISDIHIGNNTTACWYNDTFHEPYLKAILEYVETNADDLVEFIILGDLFDQWTYAPDVTPPTIQDIITANPGIFGSGKALEKAVNAMEGRVSYLNGNHDISVTQDNLDLIPHSNGHKITLQPDEYMSDAVLYTHGHLYTIFNAPDPNNTVPLGHFVTRMIAYYVEHQTPVVPAWKMPTQGAPAMRDMLNLHAFKPIFTFLTSLLAGNKPLNSATVDSFVELWVAATGFPKTDKFTMADGKTKKSIQDVKDDYKNLFSDWETAHHGKEYIRKSVWTDGRARDMSWFTQQAGLKNGAAVAVTGHTHYPTNGVNAMVGDINCGFECFPKPSETTSKYTFSRIKWVTQGLWTPEMYEVKKDTTGDYSCTLATGIPKGSVLFGSLAEDFSVYFRINNQTSKKLTLSGGVPTPAHGKWTVEPPASIPIGQSNHGCWLQDSAGITGAQGKFEYTDGTDNYKIEFNCPFNQILYSNSITISGSGASKVSYYSCIGDDWNGNKYNSVVKKGHPLCLVLFISDTTSSDSKDAEPNLKSNFYVQ